MGLCLESNFYIVVAELVAVQGTVAVDDVESSVTNTAKARRGICMKQHVPLLIYILGY